MMPRVLSRDPDLVVRSRPITSIFAFKSISVIETAAGTTAFTLLAAKTQPRVLVSVSGFQRAFDLAGPWRFQLGKPCGTEAPGPELQRGFYF